MSNWLYWPATYPDTKALHLDGASQYTWKADPSFKNDTAGAWSSWVRINTLLTTDGAYTLICVADSGALVGNGKQFWFAIRRAAAQFGNTNNYLEFISLPLGTTTYVKDGSTPLAAGTWYHVAFQSDGKIYLNGVEETYQYRLGGHYTSGWYALFTATDKDVSIGARRLAGSPNNYSAVDFNNTLYFNRSLTSTEVTEIYTAGMGADPSLLSSASAIVSQYNFEGDVTDAKAVNNLTAVATPTYVTP